MCEEGVFTLRDTQAQNIVGLVPRASARPYARSAPLHRLTPVGLCVAEPGSSEGGEVRRRPHDGTEAAEGWEDEAVDDGDRPNDYAAGDYDAEPGASTRSQVRV
jgi:hypothetical protein